MLTLSSFCRKLHVDDHTTSFAQSVALIDIYYCCCWADIIHPCHNVKPFMPIRDTFLHTRDYFGIHELFGNKTHSWISSSPIKCSATTRDIVSIDYSDSRELLFHVKSTFTSYTPIDSIHLFRYHRTNPQSTLFLHHRLTNQLYSYTIDSPINSTILISSNHLSERIKLHTYDRLLLLA